MKKIDPLKCLERNDKWYLGGGKRLIWAPPFPAWLDRPGFWDTAHYYNYETGPVFTWTLLDEEANEVGVQVGEKKWDPASLRLTFTAQSLSPSGGKERMAKRRSSSLAITEEKACLPNDVLASTVRIKNRSSHRMTLHLIVWTIQPSDPSTKSVWLTDIAHDKSRIHFTKHCESSERPHFQFECAIGMSRKVISFGVRESERTAIQPHWKLTPFSEEFRQRRLSSTTGCWDSNGDRLVYMALHTSFEVRPGQTEETGLFFAAAPRRVETTSGIRYPATQEHASAISRQNWNDFFSAVPYFECSDEFLTRYYWYRWYGLKLNSLSGEEGNYEYPAVCEGIGYFRAPISYSAMCHMLETRWMHDPGLARGCLSTFVEHQKDDGSFPGYLDVNHLRKDFFYHANWGNSLLQLDAIHPSVEFLQSVYRGLKRYAQYFDRHRDQEVSGLYDILNHYETGQEYTHRYTAVDPDADRENWGSVFRLKGVDATVYMYELKRALGSMASRLNDADEAELWNIEAERIRSAVREVMWDPTEEMFFDVDPAKGARTKVKSATCFYPYMTDIVSELHLPGLKKHLFDPKEFWTPYPVPSLSADDQFFSAEPLWKGKRMNCPWNGRVWPMTNSHIAEALAQTAILLRDDELRKRTVDFIVRFIRMMFFPVEGQALRKRKVGGPGGDRDPKLPNCFEHYNPFTGQPSQYRGVDDYQHSWVIDLIVKYVAGVRVVKDAIVVDPFPFPLEYFDLRNVVVAGRGLRVMRKKGSYKVWVGRRLVGESILGRETRIRL